ncbi:MAG: hypothetical protein IKJ26_05740 [Clostridia bacterium]|nr:hypothetical protein [Clostridia bacterium]
MKAKGEPVFILAEKTMALFEKKPYKMNVLNAAEKAAVIKAVEIGIAINRGDAMKPVLQKALRHFKRGALTVQDLAAVMACLKASAEAIADTSGANALSTELKARAVVAVVMVSALNKLEKMF